jgi:hypothetical protein
MKNTHTDLSSDIGYNHLPNALLWSPIPSEGPKCKIRILLVETFHLIYYTTTFQKLYFFALDDLALPLRKGPLYEIRNLPVKTFHLIYYMTSILKV